MVYHGKVLLLALPFAGGLGSEEAVEHMNKVISISLPKIQNQMKLYLKNSIPQINRTNFSHHSFQGDSQRQLLQMVQRQTATSSPQILRKIEARILPRRKQRPQHESVRRLLKSTRITTASGDNPAVSVDDVEPMETDEVTETNDDGTMSLSEALFEEFEANIHLTSYDDDDDVEINFLPPPSS